jgi:hypothetical protein
MAIPTLDKVDRFFSLEVHETEDKLEHMKSIASLHDMSCRDLLLSKLVMLEANDPNYITAIKYLYELLKVCPDDLSCGVYIILSIDAYTKNQEDSAQNLLNLCMESNPRHKLGLLAKKMYDTYTPAAVKQVVSSVVELLESDI